MRQVVDADRVSALMRALGAEGRQESRVFFTGGATALLYGWRASTLDVDLSLVPEDDRLMRAMPQIKESLRINIELAAPSHFIPEVPGWQDRSPFIAREGRVSFHHYDLYSQALSKLERGHERDLADVEAMRALGLVEDARLMRYYEAIEPALYRYPAIDPPTFRAAVERVVAR